MKLLVISQRESDLSLIFKSACEAFFATNTEAEALNFDSFDALAILGGTEQIPLVMHSPLRIKAEAFAESGRPVFLEFVNSFRCVYSAQPTEALPHRLVCCEALGNALQAGAILDSRCNSYTRPHFLMPGTRVLMRYFKFTPAHSTLELSAEEAEKGEPALFIEGNVLTCAFRLCDLLKASFAPKERFSALIDYICTFLGIKAPNLQLKTAFEPKIEINPDFGTALDECIGSALELLKAHLVAPDGSRGIFEGISHNILPNGTRIQAPAVRADCTGEAAGAFLFSGRSELEPIGKKMLELCFGPLTVHSGEFAGMMRWTEEAWNVCYQDDIARAIIPSLLYAYLGHSEEYVSRASFALDFLCRTTAMDGLRPARTDILEYLKNGNSVEEIACREKGFASAHYNSWYSAALILGYLTAGNEKYLETGRKGLETLMSLYPETVREHSETGEICRLIFPIALLYTATGESYHREMLNRLFGDLLRLRHPSGGYAEWDTGYKSSCFNNAGGECSLLSENGDPVADLLYSLNWLPLGFAFAYRATGDKKFADAWKDICLFFMKTQLVSENRLLNGGWCRGIDLDRLEIFGIPHDVGWGPCSLETGWTVSEITTGMLLGRRFIDFY